MRKLDVTAQKNANGGGIIDCIKKQLDEIFKLWSKR